jgi:hypothetical protein
MGAGLTVSNWLRCTSALTGALGLLLAPVGEAVADDWFANPFSYQNSTVFKPAVDGVNFRGELFGGSISNMTLGAARGVVAAPVGNQFGAQLDVLVGNLGGDSFGNLVGRYFWRDPNQGMLGIYVSETGWGRFGGIYATQVGPEFELYRGRWTLRGVFGAEFGESVVSTSVTSSGIGIPGGSLINTSTFTEGYDVKTRFFDQINLSYYLTDNWQAFIGHRYIGGKHALALGTEYALPLGGGRLVSLFAEGRVGSSSFEGAWGGLKFYLANNDKSLVRRNREDNIQPWDNLFTILGNSIGSNSSTSSNLHCNNGAGPSPGTCETFGGVQ